MHSFVSFCEQEGRVVATVNILNNANEIMHSRVFDKMDVFVSEAHIRELQKQVMDEYNASIETKKIMNADKQTADLTVERLSLSSLSQAISEEDLVKLGHP